MMSPPFAEQFYTAQKAGFEALLGLSNKVLGSVGELAELNWQTVKTALAENQELLTKAFSENNAQGFLSLPVGMAQPAIHRAPSYRRQVSEIMPRAQGEVSATTSALVQQYRREAQTLLENLANKRPG
jgi:phasin family protein